jgi:class 3 adenylate cyclase
MESLTKEFQVATVVSEGTVNQLDGAATSLRPLGEAQVRGKAKALRVFTLDR